MVGTMFVGSVQGKIVHLAIVRNLWKNFHYTLVNYLPHSVTVGAKLLCKTMPTKDQGHNLGLHSVFYVPKISLKNGEMCGSVR